MPRLSRRRRLPLRTQLPLLLGTAAMIGGVVACNQPRVSSAPPPAPVPVVAHAATHHDSTPTAPTPRTPPPQALRLLHQSISFRDAARFHPGSPPIEAVSGILIDVDSRTTLWERDPHSALPPASTAKVLTSLVALTNFSAGRLVTISPASLGQAGDETVMGLHAGQQLTVEELLQGALLVSGNDAATAIAADTVGVDAFVAAMNAQEAALGLHDSHFVSPVGLDDPAQRASAYDLAAIAIADVTAYPLFRQIVARTDADLQASPLHPDFSLVNLNRLLRMYPGADGIKPGWTGDAGPCLISMAERSGHRMMAVLLNAPRLYNDSRALLDWGFTQLGLPTLITPPPAPPAKVVPPLTGALPRR
ncbi:MAG: D-alanyl-D-alanine carboxypeptidase [Chloroflexi bacterium]|nr:MAG: D-alanyl-D-alanine carboxypeptidase [Chloroflexota bacterium]